MRMRQQHPDPMVLWYDAVTVEGQLSWQNTLNDANRYAALVTLCVSVSTITPLAAHIVCSL